MNEQNSETLARLFDEVQRGERSVAEAVAQHPEYGTALTEMVDLVQVIQSVDLPAPTPRFRSAARQRILTALIASQPAPAPTYSGLRGWWWGLQNGLRRRQTAAMALLAALVLALFSGGTVLAAQGALPGDALYPLKLQLEEVQLAVSSEQADQLLYMQFADARVSEARGLAAQGRLDQIPTVVNRLERHLAGALPDDAPGGAEAPLAAAGLSHSLEVINELIAGLPAGDVPPGLENAAERIQRNQQRLETMFPDGLPGRAGEGKPAGKPGRLPLVGTDEPDEVVEGTPSPSAGDKPGREPPGQSKDKPGRGNDPAPAVDEPPPAGSRPDKPADHPGRLPLKKTTPTVP